MRKDKVESIKKIDPIMIAKITEEADDLNDDINPIKAANKNDNLPRTRNNSTNEKNLPEELRNKMKTNMPQQSLNKPEQSQNYPQQIAISPNNPQLQDFKNTFPNKILLNNLVPNQNLSPEKYSPNANPYQQPPINRIPPFELSREMKKPIEPSPEKRFILDQNANFNIPNKVPPQQDKNDTPLSFYQPNNELNPKNPNSRFAENESSKIYPKPNEGSSLAQKLSQNPQAVAQALKNMMRNKDVLQNDINGRLNQHQQRLFRDNAPSGANEPRPIHPLLANKNSSANLQPSLLMNKNNGPFNEGNFGAKPYRENYSISPKNNDRSDWIPQNLSPSNLSNNNIRDASGRIKDSFTNKSRNPLDNDNALKQNIMQKLLGLDGRYYIL